MMTDSKRKGALTGSRLVLGLPLLACLLAACGDGSAVESGDDAGQQSPGDGDQQPGDGDQQPGDGDQQPGDGDTEPTLDAGTPGDGDGERDAGLTVDAGAEPDAGVRGDAGTGESDAAVEPEPEETLTFTPISLTGHDRLYAVTFDAAGNVYATGQSASGIESTTDYQVTLVKYLPSGELDLTFGNEGIASKNIAVGGTTSNEVGRGVVVQSDGKIVVAANAEHDVNASGLAARDTDFFLLRFNTDGSLDQSFGDKGVFRHDLGTGLETVGNNGATWSAADTVGGLSLAADDKLVVHGSARVDLGTEEKPRKDSDFILARFEKDGALDGTFSGDGKVHLDLGEVNASAKSVTVLADGSLVAAGYTTTGADVLNSQQPVLWKVTSAGDFDATFATKDAVSKPGVWHDYAVPPPGRAEAYGAALQGDKFVTMGYGPGPTSTNSTTDWVSLRFSADGEQDKTYGTARGQLGQPIGVTYVDAGGYGDNGRAVIVLPDQRVLGIGGGRPAPAMPPAMPNQAPVDGMVAVLSPDGVPDESFGTHGVKLYDLGGASDFFWGVALSPDHSKVAIVGIKGAATPANDDDSALLLLPLK